MSIPALCAHSIFFWPRGRPISPSIGEEDDMSAVENRDGKQIQDCQIDADQGDEMNQIEHSFVGLLACHLRNQNRTAQGLHGNHSFHEFADGDNKELAQMPGLDHAVIDGIEGICLLHGNLAGSSDADNRALDGLSEDVIDLGHAGSDGRA